MNTSVGVDITFEAIKEKHDAVLIATGVYKARELNAEGDDAQGIVPALDFPLPKPSWPCDDLGADKMAEFSAEGRDVAGLAAVILQWIVSVLPSAESQIGSLSLPS